MDTAQLLKDLGQTITHHRAQKGSTQAQLAALTHLAEATIAALEAGQFMPTAEALRSLSRALGFKPHPQLVALAG